VFLAEKDSIPLDYDQKVQLLALYKQEKYGPHSPEKDEETGYFDIIGGDRRKAWIRLGNMSKEDAQKELVQLLYKAAPQLEDYVSQQWKALKLGNLTNGKMEKDKLSSVGNDQPDGQCPPSSRVSAVKTPISSPPKVFRSPLAPAALWCSPKSARQFIAQSSGSLQYQLTINPGETVTVQVPTSPGATAIFWEFVTTSGDIGFGLSFQRSNEGETVYPVESLLPVVKRDCSEDLVLGSHQYQLSGTYFLHFDNSHCPTTSKFVYYKVFYQRSTST
jgi:acyl-CoA-binding protein